MSLSPKQLEALFKSADPHDRAQAARAGYKLEQLTYDDNHLVRWEVAYKGYNLDILVNDKSEVVRALVAEMGYGLDILIQDEEITVLSELIQTHAKENEKGLKPLLSHESPEVRYLLARNALFLDKLKNDEDIRVRLEAARTLKRIEQGFNDVDIPRVTEIIEKTVDGRVLIISREDVENLLLKAGLSPESETIKVMIDKLYDSLSDKLHEELLEVAEEQGLDQVMWSTSQ
jgi:HEAT repeat protein